MTALPFEWDGTAMVPIPSFRKRADQTFVIGERYMMEHVEQRSSATHRHYFAALNEVWQNLPEALLDTYPSAEVLRKKLLVRAGYCDERSIVCTSKAEAARLAAFMQPLDEYAVVTVREAVVRVFTAQSQSTKAMGKQVFAESKDKVLALAADLIGVKPEDLAKHSEAA